MRPEQLSVAMSGHPLKIILKARQLGMTTYIQIDMLDDCLFAKYEFKEGDKSSVSSLVIAHIRQDAETFFKDKIKFAYDEFVKNFSYLVDINDDFVDSSNSANTLYFGNDSRIIVATSGRSGTYQRLHISEYGKLCAQRPDKAEEVRSGALNTVVQGQSVTIESTAEGRMGHFYELCMKAYRLKQEGVKLTPMDYEFFFFPWFDDPGYILEADFEIPSEYVLYFKKLSELGIELTLPQKMWYTKKAEEQGDKMKREYPSYVEEAFESAIDGSYFSKQMGQVRSKKQITRVPIETGYPIHTFWDLGRDTTAIWFFQEIGLDYRMVDYFENQNEDMAYYANVLKKKTNGGSPYLYGTAFLPHDGTRKSVVSNLLTPAYILQENGFATYRVERAKVKANSIERARQVIPKIWFDKAKCEVGIRHLDNYRKSWDDKLGDWKKEPVHDQASHGADAFMTFCDGYSSEEEEYDDGHDDRTRNATTGY